MAQQLIFTSAVAGLNPGSSGYCTVARSEAMREAVVTRLEQWSVYTHQAGGQNPVVCAYRVLNLRGSVFHVLTRIVDSGLDYTGRTNFLAHHLVFQPHELHGACSPAEVFLQWPGWMNQWQGNPRYLEDDGLSLHSIPRSTKMPAETWKQWAGDAGAATLLVAESGGSATARPADLVVPIGSESVLPHLYAESLHLIDPKGENAPAAWAVPFSTFLQSQDDPGDFRWRGLSPGNRTRAAGECIIDFVDGLLPTVTQKTLSTYARSGMRVPINPLGAVAEYSKEHSLQTTMATSAMSNIRTAKVSQPSARTGGRAGRNPAVQDSSEKGVPKWVLVGLLCVIPIGLVAGLWIGRQFGQREPVRPPSLSVEPSSPIAEAPSTPAPPTPEMIAVESVPTPTPTPLAPTPTPTPEAELIAAKLRAQEKELVDKEIARLPKGTMYFEVGSIKRLTIRDQDKSPIVLFLHACTKPDAKYPKIDFRYDTLDVNAHANASSDGIYGNQQLKTSQDPDCSVTEAEVRSEANSDKLTWVTLRLQDKTVDDVHFVLAKSASSFSQSCFRLSRQLFTKDEGSQTLLFGDAARQQLSKIIESWLGLEWPMGVDHTKAKFTFHAACVNPTTNKLVSLPTTENFSVSYRDVGKVTPDELQRANDTVAEKQRRKDDELRRQQNVKQSRERLSKPSFPESVKPVFQNADNLRVGQNSSGQEFYKTVCAWLQAVGNDNYPLSNYFKGDQTDRYKSLMSALSAIRNDATAKVNKEPSTPKAPLTVNRQMLDLVVYLQGYVTEVDAAFLAQNSSQTDVQAKQSLNELQSNIEAAIKYRDSLTQQSQTKIDPDKINMWIEATINQTPVRLVEFVDEAHLGLGSSTGLTTATSIQ